MKRYLLSALILIPFILMAALYLFTKSQIIPDQSTNTLKAGGTVPSFYEALTDNGKVIVGDPNEKSRSPQPQITLTKWDESTLKIRYAITNDKTEAIDNGIKWIGKNEELIYKQVPAKKTLSYKPKAKPVIRLAQATTKLRYIDFGKTDLTTLAASYELFEKEQNTDPSITTYIPNETGYVFFGYKTAEIDLKKPKDITLPIVRLKSDMESFACPVIPFTKESGFVVRFYYPNIVKNGELYRNMFVEAINTALRKEGVTKNILRKSDFLYYFDGIRPVQIGRIGYDTNNLIFYIYTKSPVDQPLIKDNLRIKLILRDVLFPFSDLKALKGSLTNDFKDNIVNGFLKLSKFDAAPSQLSADEQNLLGRLRGLQNEKDWKYDAIRSDLPNRIAEQDKFDKFEFDILLHQKPQNNIFTYEIDTDGLDFFYQPPISEAAKDNGDYQPENVAGSYAVYKKSSSNIYNNSVDAEKYKTGKVMHIYRPKVTDNKGNMTWGTLNIDTDKHQLTVTVDKDWLSSASYPVLVDPTFGYTNIGASFTGSVDIIRGSYFSAPENGSFSSISAYLTAGTCFSEDTLITMADGSYKKIADVKIGDMLKSYNEKTHQFEVGTVEKTYFHPPDLMGDYYLEITTDNKRVVKITPNHPVFRGNKWIPANKLKEGDYLLSEKNENIKIVTIRRIYSKIPVYNLEVSKNHNYFANFLAHNKKGNVTVTYGVYKQSDNTKVLNTNVYEDTNFAGSSTGWYSIPATGSAVASTSYWLYEWGTNNGSTSDTDIYYDTGGNGVNKTLSYGGSWPDPLTGTTTDNLKYSIYATYTASGGTKTNLKGGMNLRGNINFR